MSIFENIRKRVGNKSRSGDWFRSQLMEELADPNLNDDAQDTFGFEAGQLFMFTYNPITQTLPFYDAYPLVYVIELKQDGFLGCNLHYVELRRRDELAKSLLNNSAQGAVAVPSRTLHKYRYSGVQGMIYKIPEKEWSGVAQLPTERFIDMRGIVVPKHKVYSKS